MSQENKALTRRSWEIVAKGSLETLDDALQEVYAHTIVMHEPDEDVRGIEGLTQFVSMIRSTLPNLRVTLEDDVAEGDKVVSRWRAQGTPQGELMGSAPTGNEVRVTGITIHRIEDGKIVEEWENWDALGLMQQIGAVPSPEQSEEASPT
jgi:predicted ester cyclase